MEISSTWQYLAELYIVLYTGDTLKLSIKNRVALAEQLYTWLALNRTEWLPKFKIAKANVSLIAVSALIALDAIQKGTADFSYVPLHIRWLYLLSGDCCYRNHLQIDNSRVRYGH